MTVTTDEAAEIAGVDPATIRKWVMGDERLAHACAPVGSVEAAPPSPGWSTRYGRSASAPDVIPRGGRVILLAVDETSTETELTDTLTELRRRQQVCTVPKIRDDLGDAIDRCLDLLALRR